MFDFYDEGQEVDLEEGLLLSSISLKKSGYNSAFDKRIAVSIYPYYELRPINGRRTCGYNMDGELVV